MALVKVVLQRDGFKVKEQVDPMGNTLEMVKVRGDDFSTTMADVADALSKKFKVRSTKPKQTILKDNKSMLYITPTGESSFPVVVKRFPSMPSGLGLNKAASELLRVAKLLLQ